MWAVDDLSVMGIRGGVANLFLDQSIGIDDTNTFQIHFSSCMKIVGATGVKAVGATVLGGLWALEMTWPPAETNLRCVRSSGICMLIPA